MILRRWLASVRTRLRGGAAGPELDEELRVHLEMAVEEHLGRGMAEREATRAARRALGVSTSIKEARRQADSLYWLDTLVQDLRYGVRSLRRSPRFTVAVTLILGLGVGMTTTVFAIVDSLLLNAVPFAESHRQLVPLLGIAPELGRASAPDERGRRRSLPKLASPRPCRRRGWSDTQWRGQLKVRGSARKPFPPARSTTAVNPLRASSAPDEAIAGRRGRRAPGAGQ